MIIYIYIYILNNMIIFFNSKQPVHSCFSKALFMVDETLM